MATATKSFDDKMITVRMNKDEANTLAVILANVGGSPTDSPRKHTASVRTALLTSGIVHSLVPEYKLCKNTTIYFDNYPPVEVLKDGKIYLAADGRVYQYFVSAYGAKGYFTNPGDTSMLAEHFALTIPKRPLKLLEPKAIAA